MLSGLMGGDYWFPALVCGALKGSIGSLAIMVLGQIFQAGRAFDEDAYERFLDWMAEQPVTADWLVLPDIVAGGLASLALSMRYINRCMAVAPMVLIAVQDGMETSDLALLVGPQVGIFLGGSTEWKIATMAQWGRFCAENNVHYHVARVNSIARMSLAISCGAQSVDGSSASRYAVTLPKLAYAARQSDLLMPRRGDSDVPA